VGLGKLYCIETAGMGWGADVALFGHRPAGSGSERRKSRAIFQSSGKFSPLSAPICKSRSAGCARHVPSWSHP